MGKYHVGCGIAGIYAGTVKNPNEWRDKSCVTDEAIEATRDWMVDNLLGGIAAPDTQYGSYEWKLKDGRKVRLSISIEPADQDE